MAAPRKYREELRELVRIAGRGRPSLRRLLLLMRSQAAITAQRGDR